MAVQAKRNGRRTPAWLAAGLAITLATSGCVTNGGPNQTAGTLLGAAAGGYVGSQFGDGGGRAAATAVGTLTGAAVGSSVGAAADRRATSTHDRAPGRVRRDHAHGRRDRTRHDRQPGDRDGHRSGAVHRH